MSEVETLAAVRSRTAEELTPADRRSAVVLGVGFVASAVWLAVAGREHVTAGEIVPDLLLVVLYALAHRTVFESGTGGAVPTEPVLVAILFGVQLPLVPLVVLAGLQLGAIGEAEPGRWWYRLAVRSASGWHCLGPVAVLWVADPGPPALRHWPVYLLALSAQFVVDAVVAAIRSSALGSSPGELVRPLAWTMAVDAMLAPVGLAAVLAAAGSPAVYLLVLAPLGLISLLARDRGEHLERAVALGQTVSEVRTEARVDPMTGIANRRAWQEAAEAAEAARAGGRPALLVLADLDHLKRANDLHGHDAGDRLITTAARVLVEAAPSGAVVARVGGDEFAVLVPDVDDPQVGAELIESIRRRAAAADPVVSISLGAAVAGGRVSVTDAVALADAAASVDKASRRAQRAGDVVDPPTSPDFLHRSDAP